MILDFQNNGAVVLTTQEPAAFLNFRWEPGDGSIFLQAKSTSDVSARMLYVNGLDISQEASLYGDPCINTELYLGDSGDPSTASFHIYTRELGPFDANLQIGYSYAGTFIIPDASITWNNSGFGSFSTPADDVFVAQNGNSGDSIYSNLYGLFAEDTSVIFRYQGNYNKNQAPDYPFPTLEIFASSGPPDWISETIYYTPTSDYESFDVSLYIPYSSVGVDLQLTWYAALDPSVTSFDISNMDFSFTGVLTGSYDVSVLNRPYIVGSDSINTFQTSNVQTEGDTSYLLLRTNPKFSGNIKLTVDPSNLMYLDTFKVSDVLSNKLYRKQRVSSHSFLSGDIRRTFSSMPLGEMYRVGDGETLNIAIPETDLWEQYNMEYSYGARLFEDELYEEDYSMLAPLWINNNLPDYFAIFRLDGQFNPESYPDGGGIPDYTGLATKFFENGEIIESWGIKEDAPLGDYLRNHLQELQKVISPSFISLSDPELLNPDPNTWYGIAIDKGIIAGRSETPYFFDQKASNFTDMNAFVSQGFERLNLLCPNLVNLEYIFNDSDVSLYTMQRYFGLYMTENPLYQIAYYAEDPDSSINIISLDGKDSNNFISSAVFDSSGNISSSYQNRLFTLDDILSIKRIKNLADFDGTQKSEVEEWLNKPGDLLFSTEVKKEEGFNKFISLKLNSALSQGEHLRIIDETDFIIYEIYGIEIDLLDAGESWTYASEYSESGYPTVYRTFFSVKGDKEDQNTAIWNAWRVFEGYLNTPFKVWRKKDESHSIQIEDWAIDHQFKFQRLTAQTTDYIFDPSSGAYDPNSPFNAAAKYSDIYFFGTLEPSKGDFERIKYDSSYGPINFELYGDRMSVMVDFFNPDSYHFYSMDSSISQLFEENMLYLSEDKWYRLVNYFDVSTLEIHSLRYIEDPTSGDNRVMVNTDYPIITLDNYWNSYALYPLIISLMGINPVKDFDYTVYDSSTLDYESRYWYKREGDASTFEFLIPATFSEVMKCSNAYEVISGTGSITIDGSTKSYSSGFRFNTFDNSALINATTKTRITYAALDSSVIFKSYKDGQTEEHLEDYYQDSSVLLRYGLIIPTVTKWVGIGSDCRGNPLRLVLDTSIFDVSTNFIPDGESFKGEIFYPSFKYLDPGDRNWRDYIFFDINDSIEYIQDGSLAYTSFKELMLNEPEIDVFSKLVYSNNNVNGTELRSSIVYYNNFKDSLDTIISGLNLSISVRESARNIVDIQDWNRYRISAVAVPSRNRDNNSPIEVFINENTETILIVWYQGNDILNYTYRTSSTMMGKGVLDPDKGTVQDLRWRGYDHTDKHFSHVKTPFGVNNASLSSNIFNLYGIDSTYDGSIASPFAQLNLNLGDNLLSIFNAYNGNSIPGTGFLFDDRQYNSFRQYIDYSYIKSDSTFGQGILNHAYSYMRNENLYRFNTCSLETLDYIFDFNKIRYYIIRGEVIYTSDSFTSEPLRISINPPRDYEGVVTYNGWFKPAFNNILEFSYNEEKDIIDIVQKDFTFSNTNLVSYSNIPQFWYNKVVETVTSYDISAGNAIDYVDGQNPFLSQWDGAYYYQYDQGAKSTIDGYNATLEKPSYFGSKLISLPDGLELDSWDITTTNEDFGPNRISLSYNLTRSIVNIFKSNDTFIANWSDLTQSDNVIDGYIKNTVTSYYNISKPKIKVEIWRKTYQGELSRIAYDLDDTFTKWNEANVDGVLNYINNEYIYTVNVPLNPMYIYYVKFTLFEK